MSAKLKALYNTEALQALPEEAREQLTAITQLFAACEQVQLLMLFGSYARGDFVIDLNTGYRSDYDLLIVTQTAKDAADSKIFFDLEDQARQIAGMTPLSIIRHDITELNREIRSGQFFFAEIVSEGKVLYNTHHVQLAKPKATTPQERFEVTRRYFSTWFASANALWIVSHNITFAERRMAAFLQHQAAERYFHAVTLVFEGYKHQTHNLEFLARRAELHHEKLQPAMARSEPHDKHIFSLLRRAYIEARYNMRYDVTQDELDEMSARVRDLALRVHQACSEKLASYFGAAAIGELPPVPSRADVKILPQPPPDFLGNDEFTTWQKLAENFAKQAADEYKERGHKEGIKEGHAAGLQEGQAQERARAIIDVLKHRNIAISDAEAERILACRDSDLLAQYWERVFVVQSVVELLV
ncbi:MAG: HEPN domain-containing protein [Deltaproteobacteria bacterium]|nr:HEPN domain-containing protein [Deltaproteobacteria bacterium]